jgi:hypothetical protein
MVIQNFSQRDMPAMGLNMDNFLGMSGEDTALVSDASFA